MSWATVFNGLGNLPSYEKPRRVFTRGFAMFCMMVAVVELIVLNRLYAVQRWAQIGAPVVEQQVPILRAEKKLSNLKKLITLMEPPQGLTRNIYGVRIQGK
ncbi:hypothetical protein [Pseudomonas protegens]